MAVFSASEISTCCAARVFRVLLTPLVMVALLSVSSGAYGLLIYSFIPVMRIFRPSAAKRSAMNLINPPRVMHPPTFVQLARANMGSRSPLIWYCSSSLSYMYFTQYLNISHSAPVFSPLVG